MHEIYTVRLHVSFLKFPSLGIYIVYILYGQFEKDYWAHAQTKSPFEFKSHSCVTTKQRENLVCGHETNLKLSLNHHKLIGLSHSYGRMGAFCDSLPVEQIYIYHHTFSSAGLSLCRAPFIIQLPSKEPRYKRKAFIPRIDKLTVIVCVFQYSQSCEICLFESYQNPVTCIV